VQRWLSEIRPLIFGNSFSPNHRLQAHGCFMASLTRMIFRVALLPLVGSGMRDNNSTKMVVRGFPYSERRACDEYIRQSCANPLEEGKPANFCTGSE
jgi:hypothetical protein